MFFAVLLSFLLHYSAIMNIFRKGDLHYMKWSRPLRKVRGDLWFAESVQQRGGRSHEFQARTPSIAFLLRRLA